MPKRKIMIVEDERITALDLEKRLLRLGYDVAGNVSTGEAAIACTAALKPEMVLMDIVLTGPMNGVEAGSKIQREHGVPVVFSTAHADTETFERAKQVQPCGYLVKPFSDGELHRMIELALHKHHDTRTGEFQR